MPEPTVLLTGARAPAALEWARQFAGAGWRVLAADSMPHPLASWSRVVSRTWRVPPARQDPQGFVQAVAGICLKEEVDLIIPVCEEIFELSRGSAHLPKTVRLWAEPLGRLRELHDKHAFMTLAARLGLPIPLTKRITSLNEVRILSGDWFLKPCFSRFAVAGRRWRSGAGSRGAVSEEWLSCQVITPSRPWVAQEFLSGQGWCAYALAEAGHVLSLVCYPVEWTAGAGACVAFTARSHAGVEAWVQNFTGAASLTGQLAFDFIEVPGRGVLPLECNPRATSGIHLLPQAAQAVTKAISEDEGQGGHRSAITDSVSGNPAQMSGMLCVPMLLYGLPQAIRRGTASEWLRTWRMAHDVVAAPQDAAPAWLGNIWTVGWFAREARRLRCSLTAATTADLEWNGDSDMFSSPE